MKALRKDREDSDVSKKISFTTAFTVIVRRGAAQAFLQTDMNGMESFLGGYKENLSYCVVYTGLGKRVVPRLRESRLLTDRKARVHAT